MRPHCGFAAFGFLGLVGLLGANSCLFPSTDDDVYGPLATPEPGTGAAPVCVTTYPAGTTLHLVLGEVYDQTSDYLYDDSFLTRVGPACGDQDDLTTGSSLVVTLQTTLANAQVCAPYVQFDPATLQSNSELPEFTLQDVLGVTIAATFEQTTVAGATAYWVTVVATPSQNPNGTLTVAELPPLVVSRTLATGEDYGTPCNDVWVATLEPAP